MNDELNTDLTDSNRYIEEFSKFSTMTDSKIDFESEFHQMERQINFYKSQLQSCRDKYEGVQMGTRDVKRMQRKTLFVLNNTQLEEQILDERLRDLHLSYETCVKKLDREDLDETICAKINELATQRKTLMEEIEQLKKRADENIKKLDRVKAMITEQEKKNAHLFEELKERSKNPLSIPVDVKQRMDDVFERRSRYDI